MDVPKDVQLTPFALQLSQAGRHPRGTSRRSTGHPRQIDHRHAEAILAAERPTFYVGGGAVHYGRLPGGPDPRGRRRPQMPVVTTLQGQGRIPDSPPAVHRPARACTGRKAANWAMNRCDLLIACGARFDDRVTGKLDAFAPGAKVIHMDVDPAEIDKNRQAQIPIVGSLEHVIPKLADSLESRANGGPPRAAGMAGHGARTGSASIPFRYRNTEHAQAGVRDRAPARADPGPGRDLGDRCRPAPDVGRPVPSVACRGAGLTSGGARHDGLRRAGGDRRQGGAGPRRSSSTSTATAASR